MDLSTKYLGLNLKNPVMPSASPLSKDIGKIKKLEDAGASAIVLWSLFEEEIESEQLELHYRTSIHSESYAEALSYFPEFSDYKIGPEFYLEHIRKVKESVSVPVIASLMVNQLVAGLIMLKRLKKQVPMLWNLIFISLQLI